LNLIFLSSLVPQEATGSGYSSGHTNEAESLLVLPDVNDYTDKEDNSDEEWNDGKSSSTEAID